MSQEQIEKALLDLQRKMDRIISGGAGCIIVDEAGDFVTELFLASFEVFCAVPIFDRKTGEILYYDYWVFFQEFYFDQGMQYSHLARMKTVKWINEDYVVLIRDDGWNFHVSMFELPEYDPKPHEQLVNWRRYYQNYGLAEAAAGIRREYLKIMEAQS